MLLDELTDKKRSIRNDFCFRPAQFLYGWIDSFATRGLIAGRQANASQSKTNGDGNVASSWDPLTIEEHEESITMAICSYFIILYHTSTRDAIEKNWKDKSLVKILRITTMNETIMRCQKLNIVIELTSRAGVSTDGKICFQNDASLSQCPCSKNQSLFIWCLPETRKSNTCNKTIFTFSP